MINQIFHCSSFVQRVFRSPAMCRVQLFLRAGMVRAKCLWDLRVRAVSSTPASLIQLPGRLHPPPLRRVEICNVGLLPFAPPLLCALRPLPASPHHAGAVQRGHLVPRDPLPLEVSPLQGALVHKVKAPLACRLLQGLAHALLELDSQLLPVHRPEQGAAHWSVEGGRQDSVLRSHGVTIVVTVISVYCVNEWTVVSSVAVESVLFVEQLKLFWKDLLSLRICASFPELLTN